MTTTTEINPGQKQALRRIARLIEANGFRQERVKRQAEVSLEEYSELKEERQDLLRLYRAAGGDPDAFEMADTRRRAS